MSTEKGAHGPTKVLFATHTCYFDASNGASVASRTLMECLARRGFAVEVVSGTVFESSTEEN